MIPLVVLASSFLLFVLMGRSGVRRLRDPIVCLRLALAATFLLTASAHFGDRRADLVRMVPPFFPRPELLVTVTGLLELAGAAGLLLPRFAPWAAAGLALLMLAMFPANVHAAREGLTIGGRAVPTVGPRAVIQVLFIAATLTAGFAPRWRRAAAAKRTA